MHVKMASFLELRFAKAFVYSNSMQKHVVVVFFSLPFEHVEVPDTVYYFICFVNHLFDVFMIQGFLLFLAQLPGQRN